MRYSNLIGLAASVGLIVFCFFPWVYIPSIQTTISGFHADHTNFGKPGLMHVILSVVALLLFSLNKIGAKRINILLCAFNFAWSLRNILMLTRCELGECPESRAGIYMIVLLSFIMLIMSLLPKGDEKMG